jgi:SAM-dependent methyltransferase
MSLPPIDRLAEVPDRICSALRRVCQDAKYDDELIMTLASLALTASGSESLPLVHHVLRRRGDRPATLARLFAYSDAVDEPTVRQLFGSRLTDALLDAAILTRDQGATGSGRDHDDAVATRITDDAMVTQAPQDAAAGIRSRFHLRPLEGLWLLADDPGGGRDAVMPPAGTTRQIVQLLAPALTEALLDVGCGPGSLALTAARRGACRVVGTDINPRAVDAARFNARLNGLETQVEFLVGDLLEPVRGTRFPLVVAQPPYVVQPPTAEAVTYLHGGPSGEELTMRLVAGLPDVLEPLGRALVLMEAVVRPDEPLHARLRPALGDAPVDLLVLAAPGPPPAVQVLAYASLEAPAGGPAYQAAAHRYMEHLESIGANDFHHALVVLRAHAQNGPVQSRLAATVPVKALANGNAAALDTLLAAIDLAALKDARLVDRSVRAARHADWIEERPRPAPDLEPVRSVRFGPGSFGSDCQLSPERYQMAAVLDRAVSIGAAVTDYAEATERTPEAVRGEMLGFVREGLMRGLLEPSMPLTAQ